jgi:MioC protein
MGTTFEVADAAAHYLLTARAHPHAHTITLNKGYKGEPLNPHAVVLVCTANTGVGDLPACIVPFYQHLRCNYPAIAGMRYGLINLGDSSYPSFAQAGQKIDDALKDLGAKPLGSPLVIDAQSGENPTTLALAWLKEWEPML